MAECDRKGTWAFKEVGLDPKTAHPKLVNLMGRLYFRTSYGQNVLFHTMEMTHAARVIAELIGSDVDTAVQGTFFHDLGKAVDHDLGGGQSHDELSKKLLEKFKKQLTVEQKELLEKATNPFFGIDLSEIYKHIEIVKHSVQHELSEEEIKKQEREETKEQKKAYGTFKESLPISKKKYFEKEIEPFFDDRGSINDPFERFDTGLAQRWIFNRVVDLGYNPKLHSEFDNMVNRYDNSGRSEHKAERIGKKYQWIAYHEFMALVSDHFEFKGDSWSNLEEKYKGPWNPYVRDIDPSSLFKMIHI